MTGVVADRRGKMIEISSLPDPACRFRFTPATDYRSRLDEMRKVVVQQFVTVDGFAAGPNSELDFVTDTGRPRTRPPVRSSRAGCASLSLDTILLGAVRRHLPDVLASTGPSETTETRRIADALNATPKVVFSSTLESAPWGSWEPARVVAGEAPAEQLSRLKADSGKDVII